MSLRIEWTRIALQSLSDVLEYTYEYFGTEQLTKLRHKITSTAQMLSTFPYAGKVEDEYSEHLGVEYRSMVVIHEIKLFYTITDETLFLEFVKDTRQDDITVIRQISD